MALKFKVSSGRLYEIIEIINTFLYGWIAWEIGIEANSAWSWNRSGDGDLQLLDMSLWLSVGVH